MTAPEVYVFGGFTLDVAERRLTSRAGCIALAPKAHDLLVALVRNAGRLQTKHQLLQLVWPESFVDEGILSVHVSSLRKALGDSNRTSTYIETVPRTGYRFVAPVTATEAGGDSRGARWSLAVVPARQADAGTAAERPAIDLVLGDVLIERLGSVAQLVVRPARAVRAYITSVDEPAVMARTLQVDAVLASRLATTGGRVAVSAQLIASDGATLWTGKFERPGTDLGAIADAIADSVIARLGVSASLDFPFVPGGGTSRRRKAVSRPLEAYELFGRGRAHLLTASYFELPKAVEAFRAAIALDATYAGACAGLALACCAQAGLRARPHHDAYAEAKTAALRALAMDDQCADAQVALGTVLFLSEWDWAGAERSFQHALELNPNHTEAYLHYGSLMDATRRLDRGLALKQQALERDPFSAMVQIQIATSYLHQRRYADVILWATKALELDSKHLLAGEFLASAYWMQGDVDRFLAANLAQARSFGATEVALADLGRSCSEMRTAYAADGRQGMARYMLGRMPRPDAANQAIQRAVLHAELGELDAAFAFLNQGLATRDPCLVHLAVSPQWDPFRADPRFDSCLALMGLSASEQFA